jgi:hypothetical protein
MFICLGFQFAEEKSVDDFLKNRKLTGSLGSLERAVATSDLVRAEFSKDPKDWKYVNNVKEPFLNHSCLDLMRWREGNCGKVTRVLVKLLYFQGYDVCRVTLHGRGFSNRASHTLVSVMINGEEYFIDSVNSPDDVNDYLRHHQVNATSFGISDYKNRHHKMALSIDSSSVINHRYLGYSFESIPYTKLTNTMGFNMRVLNFDRPGRWGGYVAESVFLIQFLLAAIGFLFWLILGWLLVKKLK